MQTRRALMIGAILAVVGLAVGINVFRAPADEFEAAVVDDPIVVRDVASGAGIVELHRSATCSCCGEHGQHLVDAGFDVVERVHATAEMADVKRALGVPESLWSCHTSVVGGYAIEGHVPADVIARLLVDRPDVDGIALPGMPAGSPGMGGSKDAVWNFTAFTDLEEAWVLVRR